VTLPVTELERDGALQHQMEMNVHMISLLKDIVVLCNTLLLFLPTCNTSQIPPGEAELLKLICVLSSTTTETRFASTLPSKIPKTSLEMPTLQIAAALIPIF
jgi:hypothetical protein